MTRIPATAFVLIVLLVSAASGCSGLCPDGGDDRAACERQVEASERGAREGWRNTEQARSEARAPATARFASDLKRGMTADELRQVAGDPNRRQRVEERETWSYDVDGSRTFNVTLVDEKVTGWRYVAR